MQRKVKFTITGYNEGTDAPSIDDMLDQLRDFILLKQRLRKLLKAST